MTHVLIVENDAGNRFTLHQLIELDGYEVDSVENGAQAIRLLLGQRPGIVVLDYCMPEINGYDVMRFIADDPTLRRCQAVILITASPGALSRAARDLLTLLEVPVLSKPFPVDDLLAALHTATDRLHDQQCT